MASSSLPGSSRTFLADRRIDLGEVVEELLGEDQRGHLRGPSLRAARSSVTVHWFGVRRSHSVSVEGRLPPVGRIPTRWVGQATSMGVSSASPEAKPTTSWSHPALIAASARGRAAGSKTSASSSRVSDDVAAGVATGRGPVSGVKVRVVTMTAWSPRCWRRLPTCSQSVHRALSGGASVSWDRTAVGRGDPLRSRTVAAGWPFEVDQVSAAMPVSWPAGATATWRAAWLIAAAAEMTGKVVPARPAASAVVMAR